MRSSSTTRLATRSVARATRVVGEDRRVGEHDAFDRAVADVALVPQRDVFETGADVAAHHARQAGEVLAT